MITILRNSFREFMFISGEYIYLGRHAYQKRPYNYSQAWSRKLGSAYWEREEFSLAMALAFAPEAGPVQPVNPAEVCQIFKGVDSPDDEYAKRYMVMRFIELDKGESITHQNAKQYFSAYMVDDPDGWDAGCYCIEHRSGEQDKADSVFLERLPSWWREGREYIRTDRFTEDNFTDQNVSNIIHGAFY